MTTLYTSDDRTKFCGKAMKAHGGVWNAVTNAWMSRGVTRTALQNNISYGVGLAMRLLGRSFTF